MSERGGARRARVWLLWACLLGSVAVLAQTRSEPPAAGDSTRAAVSGEPDSRVGVLYLTNRRRYEDRPAPTRYSGERGEAHFGHCEVEFTPIPIINDVAPRMSFYVQSETQEVVLAERIETDAFWGQLQGSIDRNAGGPVVLFVHGYNYGFERTCRRAAELQRSLGDRATLIVFSWPSNAVPTDYVPDQADMEWSAPLLAETITKLGARVGVKRLRLVAHSLGTRGVVLALQQLAAQTSERPVIERLILLAPDFDSQTFVELLPRLEPLAGGITLYASSNDTPLKLSRQLSGYPRLGEAGPYLTVVPGIQTIDVSPLGRYQFTGHEYFYFHPVVTADLVTLLTTGAGAAERTGLRSRSRDGIRYWELAGSIDQRDAATNAND